MFTDPKDLTLPEEIGREGLPHSYGIRDFWDKGLLDEGMKPRLAKAIGYFNDEENDELLTDLYQYWRDYDEYMVLHRCYLDHRDYLLKHEYVGVKCSKRGNDVHSRRVRKRLNWLNKLENIEFFSAKDCSMEKRVSTSLLWITLTYDPKRCSRRLSWENIGFEYARFMHLVRKRWGKVSTLRVWETFENGYPHVHVCLLFHDAKFSVFPHVSMKEGKFSFRIHDKAQFNDLWHSFVDVEAISSMKKLGSYVRKYQTKVYEGSDSKSVKTMAFCWLFRKRSFALSGSFRVALSDLIRDLHNWAMKEGQISLDGKFLDRGKWEFVGIFAGLELEINGAVWFQHLTKDQIEIVTRRMEKNR